ncbi:MAG: hypothetical protein ACKO66_11150 [Flavobacteriales bacterium]
MNKLLLFIGFWVVLAGQSFGVDAPPRFDFQAKFYEANKRMEERLWTQSINLWKEILEQNPNQANINYKIGYCYLQTPNSKLEALQYLEVACQKRFSRNYDPYDATEKKAPIQALYYLGRAQALNLKLDDAILSFQKVQKALGKKHLMYKDATQQLAMCEEAKRQIANPKNYKITNIGTVINTPGNEYSPVISLDESQLFFTSRRIRPDSTNSKIVDFDTGEFKEDIYVSFKLEDGTWGAPELLNLNTDQHDATIGVSPDGQTLYIYRDIFGDGQLYSSTLIGETWNEPQLLGSDINTANWETHATVAADQSVMYFVSDRLGGLGGRDIYRCVKLPNGEWSRALNIGNQVNTPYEEDAPFLSADGKTLYFSSNGHTTMGGFDIFYSRLGEDGLWGLPVNMGYPLNTVDDDVFFIPLADGRRAFYSSSRDGGYGLKDIYMMDMPDVGIETQLAVLKGYIIPAEGQPLPDDLRILVTNEKNSDVAEYRPRKRDGGYLAVLNPCSSYKIEYFKGKELLREETISVPCQTNFQEIEREVFIFGETVTDTRPVQDPQTTNKDDKPVDDGKIKFDDQDANNVDDAIESQEIKDFAFDAKDPINRQYIESKGFAQYSRFFVYGLSKFDATEKEFALFIKDVADIIDGGKKPLISVEASASHVPIYKITNEQLVQKRSDTAHDLIRQELAKLGKTEGVHYTFDTPKTAVQGKEYANDSKKNRLLYEQFQYVKVRAQG